MKEVVWLINKQSILYYHSVRRNSLSVRMKVENLLATRPALSLTVQASPPRDRVSVDPISPNPFTNHHHGVASAVGGPLPLLPPLSLPLPLTRHPGVKPHQDDSALSYLHLIFNCVSTEGGWVLGSLLVIRYIGVQSYNSSERKEKKDIDTMARVVTLPFMVMNYSNTAIEVFQSQEW